MVAASPEASWETIPAGGKGRRSFTGGGRRSSAEQPAAHAPRAVVAELGPKRAVPSSGAQHVQHAIRAAAVAASPAQQHRASVQQQQESPTLGHQPRHHVRAMPVSNMPSANSRVRQSFSLQLLATCGPQDCAWDYWHWPSRPAHSSQKRLHCWGDWHYCMLPSMCWLHSCTDMLSTDRHTCRLDGMG